MAIESTAWRDLVNSGDSKQNALANIPREHVVLNVFGVDIRRCHQNILEPDLTDIFDLLSSQLPASMTVSENHLLA